MTAVLRAKGVSDGVAAHTGGAAAEICKLALGIDCGFPRVSQRNCQLSKTPQAIGLTDANVGLVCHCTVTTIVKAGRA